MAVRHDRLGQSRGWQWQGMCARASAHLASGGGLRREEVAHRRQKHGFLPLVLPVFDHVVFKRSISKRNNTSRYVVVCKS